MEVSVVWTASLFDGKVGRWYNVSMCFALNKSFGSDFWKPCLEYCFSLLW